MAHYMHTLCFTQNRTSTPETSCILGRIMHRRAFFVNRTRRSSKQTLIATARVLGRFILVRSFMSSTWEVRILFTGRVRSTSGNK